MLIAKSIRLGLLLLVGLNLLMASGSIWVFMRMAPAIEVIIERNERSLQASEEMLASLALLTENTENQNIQYIVFKSALKRVKNNITEQEEPAAIEAIQAKAVEAFQGDVNAREKTVQAILNLAEINREAMINADLNAKQLGYAGAWGIVFMAIVIFVAGRLFYRMVTRNVLYPIEEVYRVMKAQQQGNNLRRCTGKNSPQEVMVIFNGINEILDKCQFKLNY